MTSRNPKHAPQPVRPDNQGGPTSQATVPNISGALLASYYQHELRTPLNAVLGFSEVLIEELSSRESHPVVQDLKKIRESGLVTLKKVDDILAPLIRIPQTGQSDAEAVVLELRKILLPSIAPVIVTAADLMKKAEGLGLAEFIPDLRKIHSSAVNLVVFIKNAFRLGQLLPFMRAAEESGAADMSAADRPEFRSRQGFEHQGMLLVVDDSTMNREVLARHLNRFGHQVFQAENGNKALQLMDSRPFDLVLLDIMMPDIDGYEVLARMKARPVWRDIPVIMVSALGETESVVRCIELGADEYMQKPYNPVLLKARIDSCLEKKRLRDKEHELLQNLALMTRAAEAIENGAFSKDSLEPVARRNDELGHLARVFTRMALHIQDRQATIQKEIKNLSKEGEEASALRPKDSATQLREKAQDLLKWIEKEGED